MPCVQGAGGEPSEEALLGPPEVAEEARARAEEFNAALQVRLG